ncbi:MAG: dynamin family protein [Candidatus Microthrix sp.]|nr:dynamin family protein [Candidatus Microthrix sp.]
MRCAAGSSNGKSSLINALIGEDLLPVGVLPVTSIATEVRHGATAAPDRVGRRHPSLRRRHRAGGMGERGQQSRQRQGGSPGFLWRHRRPCWSRA